MDTCTNTSQEKFHAAPSKIFWLKFRGRHCYGKTISRKFDSLRTIFRREFRKVELSKKSGSSTDEIYKPTWHHYNNMLFLRDVIKAGDTKSNFPDNSEDADVVDKESTPQLFTPKAVNKKRRAKVGDDLRDEAMSAAIEFLRQPPTPEKPTPAPDQCSVFGQFVAGELRNMNQQARDMAMLDIQTTLIKHKYPSYQVAAFPQQLGVAFPGFGLPSHTGSLAATHQQFAPVPEPRFISKPQPSTAGLGHQVSPVSPVSFDDNDNSSIEQTVLTCLTNVNDNN